MRRMLLGPRDAVPHPGVVEVCGGGADRQLVAVAAEENDRAVTARGGGGAVARAGPGRADRRPGVVRVFPGVFEQTAGRVAAIDRAAEQDEDRLAAGRVELAIGAAREGAALAEADGRA